MQRTYFSSKYCEYLFFAVMNYLTLKVISRAIPNYLPRYECKRGVKFIKKLFERPSIRIPSGFNIQDYKLFYQYPHVSKFSTLVKLRYYKYGLLVASSLPYIYLYQKGKIEIGFLIGFVSVAFFILLLSMYVTYAGRNLIGRMYIHKHSKDIVISYTNNFGRRINKSYMVDSVKIVDHPNILLKKFFKKVIAHEPYREFNLCTTKSIKVEHMIFEAVFPNVI